MSPRRRPPASARGFTLIEVMIAAAVLLLGIAGVVMGMQIANTTSAHQRFVTQAIHASESVMEDLLLRSAGHADLDSGVHGPRWFNQTGIETSSSNTFEVTWKIVGGQPLTGMKRVTVTTRWEEGSRERRFSITTDRP